MTLLHLRNICYSYQGIPVLENVDTFVSEGSRIGIIGPNGSGKSTLLRIIIGEISTQNGHLDWAKRPRIGYVPQAFPETGVGRQTGKKTNEKVGTKDTGNRDKASGRIDEDTPLSWIGFERSDYLGRFGIGKHLWNRPLSVLSGGEKTRLILARAFSENPGLLVLDEPTNHLDIPGIEWLEGLLKGFAGTVLIVSHDRYFLDSICNEVWHVENLKVQPYSGGYSTYVQTRRAEQANMLKEYAKWQDTVARLSNEVRTRREWYDKAHKDAGQNDYLRKRSKKHARQVKAKEKRLEALLDRKPDRPISHKPVTMQFQDGSYRTKTILRGNDFSFGYDHIKPIISNAHFRVSPGNKIAVVGPNGSGKTTMIKLFAGKLNAKTDCLWVNPNIQVGYLAQMLDDLDLSSNAAQNVSRKTGRLISEARNLLGYLGISCQTQVVPLHKLSMGERTKVALTCLTFAPYDLLLMDEPTNHLDLTAREAIEEALAAFPGAIIVATHDRFLIERCCSVIWYINQAKLHIHQGSYRSLMKWMETQNKPGRALSGQNHSAGGEHYNPQDRKAKELAARAELAYIASRLAALDDDSEKAALEAKYQEVVTELKRLRRS